jgi:hypothetical protein
MQSVIDEPLTIVMHWWLCERCGRKLGKIIGQTVIIQPRPGRVITVPISSGVTSTCKCGYNNTPPRD